MEPQFFAVINVMPISPVEYGLPAISKVLYLVELDRSDLGNPSSDPICIYYYAGMRRFLWRDKYWSEYDMPLSGTRIIIAELEKMLLNSIGEPNADQLSKWLSGLKGYHRSNSRFLYRVLYEIDGREH